MQRSHPPQTESRRSLSSPSKSHLIGSRQRDPWLLCIRNQICRLLGTRASPNKHLMSTCMEKGGINDSEPMPPMIIITIRTALDTTPPSMGRNAWNS
ncbi:hypothetical protein CDAR_49331 [Caerostris darwini]|uniref:Uncharacterized protein n=1 Tax=Caerostris darwini TaxID=1538125 RepID=A0AAV4QA51_9ARAC|nr:hypothetical protein CDAR_49331 [Caerostris darwini]